MRIFRNTTLITMLAYACSEMVMASDSEQWKCHLPPKECGACHKDQKDAERREREKAEQEDKARRDRIREQHQEKLREIRERKRQEEERKKQEEERKSQR